MYGASLFVFDLPRLIQYACPSKLNRAGTDYRLLKRSSVSPHVSIVFFCSPLCKGFIYPLSWLLLSLISHLIQSELPFQTLSITRLSPERTFFSSTIFPFSITRKKTGSDFLSRENENSSGTSSEVPISVPGSSTFPFDVQLKSQLRSTKISALCFFTPSSIETKDPGFA